MSGRGRGAASWAADSSSSRTANTPVETPVEVQLNQQATIKTQQAEIKRLNQLLEQAQSGTDPADPSDAPANRTSTNQTVETLVETLVQSLNRSNTPSGSGTTKLSKIPNPLVLTNRKDPTFESWKL